VPDQPGHLHRRGQGPGPHLMDYSYDTCMTQFSKGQASRIQKEWAAYR
jgi:hypothetical protein